MTKSADSTSIKWRGRELLRCGRCDHTSATEIAMASHVARRHDGTTVTSDLSEGPPPTMASATPDAEQPEGEDT